MNNTLDFQGYTILIIDDTPANLGVMVEHLEDCGCRVVVAQEGVEGIKRAQFIQPDLIFLDVMMPGMDGFETCHQLSLQADTRNIPVIFMTALTETTDKIKGFAAGGVDFISKPFQIEEVLARANIHLALRKAQRELETKNAQLLAEVSFREGQARILEMIATQAPLTEVFERLIRLIERSSDGALGSVLLLNPDGVHIDLCVAPGLPETYCTALVGIAIGPQVGSCGTAMFRRETVVVTDIETDPLWSDYRSLALNHGLRACWSTPILSPEGPALGSFALYYKTVHGPTPADLALIELATHSAGIAIQRYQTQARIQHMAHHDALTDLPNRILLEDRLSQAIVQAHRDQSHVGVLFIDLDHFKHVNDTLGHHVGDALLMEVAQRLRACVREGDSVARLGGDEFVISLPRLADSHNAALVAEKIVAALGSSILLNGHDLHIGASVGISLYPEDGKDAETLLRAADTAMYNAKEKGRNNYRFFTAAMNEAAQQRLITTTRLRQALDQQEFVLHYQPQVSLKSGAIIGVEALLRWNNPELGMVLPSRFISMLESTGLINEVGEWVLRTACEQSMAWQREGLPPIRMAVNLSAHQFQTDDIVRVVKQVLDETGLNPNRLELEITESVILDGSELIIGALHALKQLGVTLSLDDFGTGYSSLSYLQRFPIDRVKIDRSFIDKVTADAGSAAIVCSILDLSRNLGLDCIAEGVETPLQMGYLQNQLCSEIQGFLFSKALPALELAAMLRADCRLPMMLQNTTRVSKLLVVDDDVNVQSAITCLLRGEDIQVLCASSAEQALEVLAKNTVDVVMSDQRMLGRTGIELLAQVKRLYPDTIRILFTGYAEFTSLVEAVNQGALHKVLTKPWKDGELIENIREAFRCHEVLHKHTVRLQQAQSI
ncbi:MAG: EAL domain-containing protein [Rhodoferax sp.]|uniref:EAL domain-containing protein n=1 Tax=Rhodoferax sp. TaxID=50421 RepID=UPI002734ED27|nr:EAL domain-containing protein [Rhodoferax sp.]MDP2677741.1 EAL domain-containing protein [Rhodoferax sp.]